MSKLFDQLKDAARSREEKSPGLLLDALKRQQDAAAAPGSSGVAPEAAQEEVPPGAPQEQRAGAQSAVTPVATVAPAKAGAEFPRTRISQYSGVGLAILIFAVAVAAWRSAPWNPPRKLKIDPSELKLDRSLDLDRTTPKGTSPGGRPS